jgi:hypothetical protein
VTDETMTATTTINAPAEAVFAVLTGPGSHAAIDRTGWVREPRDRERLSASGQAFRVAMYHDNHPDGQYEMANKVVVFDPAGHLLAAGPVPTGRWAAGRCCPVVRTATGSHQGALRRAFPARPGGNVSRARWC